MPFPLFAQKMARGIRQALKDSHHLLDASHLRAMDNLSLLVEGANGNVRVNIQTDVKHKAPLKVEKRSELAPLIPRYPTDRGFLHSLTPTRLPTSRGTKERELARSACSAWPGRGHGYVTRQVAW